MGRLILILVLMTAACAGAAPLLPNGGFEEADATNAAQPAGWDRMDGLGVRWETETNGPANRFIRMNTAVSETAYVSNCQAAGLTQWVFPNPVNDPIAATYGLSYYSGFIPVATGQAYRLTFRFRGASGGGKAWVRGYGMIRNEERRLYDSPVACRAPGSGWTTLSQCFHPTKHTPAVTRIRIMLYAYWPPGVYAFDDVALAPVSDAEWQADHREND